MNREGFSLWADSYDRSVMQSDAGGTYPFAGYEAVLDAIFEESMIPGPCRVLDVGFGTGTLTKRLYDQGCAVTGIDFSERMVEIARGKMPDATLCCHDFALGLPEAIKEQVFDCVVSTYALHHLPDEDKVTLLQSLFRLLAPGGVLLVGDVAFQSEAAREACRADCKQEEWDEEEFYIAYEAFRKRLCLPSRYRQMSVCAGILMLKKPRMVLFDYGGTLVREAAFDSLKGHAALLERAVSNESGMTLEEICEFAQEQFSSMNSVRFINNVEVHEHQCLRFLFEYLGIAFDKPLVELETILWDAAAPGEAMPGIQELLDTLRALGIRAGVISNIGYSGEALHHRINRLLPGNGFEFIIATSEYVHRKPSPLIFQLALKKAELPAEDVWYAGDTFLCDVEGSAAVGITPIWFTDKPVEREEDVCCLVLDHWKKLTAALTCNTMDAEK